MPGHFPDSRCMHCGSSTCSDDCGSERCEAPGCRWTKSECAHWFCACGNWSTDRIPLPAIGGMEADDYCETCVGDYVHAALVEAERVLRLIEDHDKRAALALLSLKEKAA